MDVTGQMTTKAPTLRCQTQRMALREPRGMHKVGENSISLKEQEMIRRWSDQENCIASQNWLSRSPRFNLHINPCLQHNDAPKRMGQGPSFQGFFVCKHLAETASLWKDWDYTDTHDNISAPNTTQKKVTVVSFPHYVQKGLHPQFKKKHS